MFSGKKGARQQEAAGETAGAAEIPLAPRIPQKFFISVIIFFVPLCVFLQLKFDGESKPGTRNPG